MSNARSKIHHGFEDDLTRLVEGIEQTLPPDALLVVLGKAWTQPDLRDALRAAISLMVAVRTAEAEARRARKAVEDDVPRTHALFTAIAAALQGYFGKANPKLSQFGLPLGTRIPATGAVRVRAAAKAKLTRQLRHTLGRRQRLALVAKGPISVTLFGADGRLISSEGPVRPAEPPASPEDPGPAEVGQPTNGAPGPEIP